ncbi:hypothetical protein R1flu_005494 [Riccia fluitans]|uniref:Integral membrane bound transporter domain-containing protein n=1 Tax=Riccia fluitans TaxID=41844 RepID=A0ABD1YU40_9MARC
MQGMTMKSMNKIYERRFRRRLGEALRTGWACLLVSVILEYVPMVKDLMVVSVLSYVIAILVSGPTLGTVLRNALGLLAVVVPSLLSTMVVLQMFKPPISKVTAVVCTGISSFFITYLSNTHLLGRKSALAQVSILYIYAHYESDMNVWTFPLRMMGPDILGASMAIVATLLPFPQLALWEVSRSAKSAERGTSEVFSSAVTAFSAADTSSFGSMYLHSKILAKASTDIVTGLKAKQVNLGWEIGTSRLRRTLKRTAKILAGLNQHLLGMVMAMESGHHLNAPAILRSSLRGPLKQVVEVSKSLLKHGVELGTSKINHESSEEKLRRCLVVEGAKQILNMFDEKLAEARRTAFYQPHVNHGNYNGPESPSEIEGINNAAGDGGILWVDHRTKRDTSYVKHKFRGRVSSYFFLFNLKLYMSEVVNLVDSVSFSNTGTKMHQIVRSQRFEESVHSRQDAAEILSSAVSDTRENQASNHETKQVARNSSSSRRSAIIFSEDQMIEDRNLASLRWKCNQCSSFKSYNPELAEGKNSSTASNSIFGWEITCQVHRFLSKWGATRAQAKRSFKIALAIVIADIFSNMIVSKEKHAFWGPVTVAFLIGNYQGGSWRTASLRLQGTVLGGIYGYLALTVTKNHSWANFLALIPWVILTTFVRYSPDYGYGGLVSGFTAAILIMGDFESDIRKYAMDRITETFVGVLAFVFVETVVFPERAVRLIRAELVSSLTGLRDCVAAIVAVYTEKECVRCRTAAVNDIKELEKQLKVSFGRQTALRAEACLEPDLWFVPFPGEIYSNLIAIEGRMLDLLFFMVCSLYATTEDGALDHMQKLLKAQRSSLTALQEEVLTTIDFLQEALQLQVHGPSIFSRFKDWLFRRTRCVTDVENQQRSMAEQQPPPPPLHPLILLNHPRRHVDGSPMNLKSSMDQFEQSFEDTVEDLISSTKTQAGSPVICNSVMLSFGSLTFSLHSLLRETIHLERVVHELVQAENPWSVLDFWDTHSVTHLWQQQVSVRA